MGNSVVHVSKVKQNSTGTHSDWCGDDTALWGNCWNKQKMQHYNIFILCQRT